MRSLHVAILAVALICAVAMPAAAGQAHDVAEGAGAESKATVVQLPPNLPIQRHYYDPSTGQQRMLAGELSDENLAYSNTPPPEIYLALGIPNVVVADDLMTAAIGGCDITAYEIMVAGMGDGGVPGFTVTFDLYDRCPHGGGEVIPGAGGSVTVDHDGLHAIVIDLSAAPVAGGKTVWLAVSVDSPSAGWVFGTPAEIGFTADVYDFVFVQCAARFGGTAVYAGFHARVWCEPPFETEFPAYLNNNLNGMPWSPGAVQWAMDDIELVVDDCIMTSYEIGAVAAGGGAVTMTAELQSLCGTANTIEGTQGATQFVADGSPMFARVEFPDGVDLGGSDSFWMAYRFNPNASAIVSGEATIGHTDDLIAWADGGGCSFTWFSGTPWAGLAVNVYCLGSTPIGACCELKDGLGTCRETTELICSPDGRERRWLRGATCDDPAAFDPPCGTAACCTPPQGPGGEACFNLTRDECEAIVDDVGNPAAWRPEYFCGDSGQHCVHWPCRYADGACDVPHDTPGCMTSDCCDAVCDIDPYCCEVEWDWNCVRGAIGNYCGGSTPVSYADCWSDEPGYGAIEVGANSTSYLSNEHDQTWGNERFCCHPAGAGNFGYGGIWAKFMATHTTARIDTCGTADDSASDSLLQLMRASDHSNEHAACESLTPIACNDDGDCGDLRAAICAHGLNPGETYYILLASKSSDSTGEHVLTITSPASAPCPDPAAAPTCPAGSINWIDPPDGVVDARQPHAPDDANVLRGIDRLHIEGPIGTAPACWTVCEEGGANGVGQVEPHADCSSTLHLERAMTAGAVTRIVYAGDGTSGAFTAHPGNVDASDATDPADIVSLIDVLNATAYSPWGTYSCDIDHSGVCDPSDIIGLIDLLNGAGSFAPWMAAPLPTATGDCP